MYVTNFWSNTNFCLRKGERLYMKIGRKTYMLLLLILMLILTACQDAKPSSKNLVDSKLLEKLSSSSIGAVNPQLLFADDSNAIIYDHSGLLVFDYVEKEIIRALDFEEMDIMIQGDMASSIYVDKLGTTVFFEKLSTKEVILYDIEKDELSNLDSTVLEKGPLTEQYDIYKDYIEFYDGGIEYISEDLYPLSNLIQLSDEVYVYLTHDLDTMLLKDLKLVIASAESTDVISVFP